MAVFFQSVLMGEIGVSGVMSRRVFVGSVDDDLASAEEVMSDKRVRRLPVLNKKIRVFGLISFSDMVTC